ncbi:hypothetical protein ACFQ9X_41645 [Catenulispora yoronensis]
MVYLSLCCRGLLAAVFLLAVAGKARSRAAYRAFAASLDDVRWLPRGCAGPHRRPWSAPRP